MFGACGSLKIEELQPYEFRRVEWLSEIFEIKSNGAEER